MDKLRRERQEGDSTNAAEGGSAHKAKTGLDGPF